MEIDFFDLCVLFKSREKSIFFDVWVLSEYHEFRILISGCCLEFVSRSDSVGKFDPRRGNFRL